MWILIVSVFNSNVAFGQLLQLGVIGHHYFEHKAENSNLSFSSFLKLHYANQIKHADDRHHDHKRLPYKSQDGQLTLMSVTGDSFIQQVSFQKSPEAFYVFLQSTDCYVHQAFALIWQPPK